MKKFLPYVKVIFCCLLCFAFFIAFACFPKKNDKKGSAESSYLNIWQIDSFEGGKGSRSDYLQKIGNSFAKDENCYVNVISISAEAARINLSKGIIPDLISYGAGTYGIESYITGYTVWCNGCYCLLTLDTNSDFGDANKDNTIINEGKDNFVGAAALLYGLYGAKSEKSTGAYLKMINGNYKYLLGTQRDIFRLKTREVTFSVKPINIFNDLYQNISVTSSSNNKVAAQKFIDYVLSHKDDLVKIGMMFEGVKLYDNEMISLENVKYELKLTSPLNYERKEEIKNAVYSNDINKLKKLLN